VVGLFKRLVDGLAVSPYPAYYTMTYPYYARNPSMRNHAGVGRRPLAAPSDTEEVDRVVIFGDLLGLPAAPTVEHAFREPFQRADLVVGNLEGPLLADTAGDNAWLKAIHPDYVTGVFAGLGVDASRLVLSVSNNHSQDGGDDGLWATLAQLEALGIEATGHVVDGQPAWARRTLPSGLTVAVVAWTRWMNQPPGLRFSDPATLDVLRSEDALPLLAEVTADTRIALPHWDWEYQHFPSRETRAAAQAIAAAGFDVIGGGHQHVIQPLEVLDDCLVTYGLGNFLQIGHGMSNSLASRLGVVLEAELHRGGERRGKLAGYQLHPYLHDRERNHLATLTPAHAEGWALVSRVFDTA
jgi:poly-gamma-glutamate synthesis protein (capsule biosynthesis protein)